MKYSEFQSLVLRCVAASTISAVLSACGGGGGGPGGGNPPGNPGPNPTNVTISGKITFDRIPFDTTLGTGLNPNAPVQSPARGVVVEALNAAGGVISTTTTNAAGDYSVAVPVSTQITIRAKAQMLTAGTGSTWNFQVRNNRNGDALYALDSASFDSGTANGTRNLRAASGWGGTSYTQTRAAAPFAILDTAYAAKELVRVAAPTSVFPALNLYWSPDNRAADPLCPDLGNIGTSFYTTGGDDECATPATLPEGIYILGNFEGGDTDEFDQHVIAHEFGHYLEDKFSRSDSIGGEHGAGDELDPRVAFGEGWGNAFAGMVLNDPVYRDSFGGAGDDFDFSLEQDDTTFGDGWYSEASAGELLWDLFDPANEPADSLALGFGPIFAAMSNGQRLTNALTSIFSFVAGLKDEVPSQAAAISSLVGNEDISGSDAFATGESNRGSTPLTPTASSVLPVYRVLSSAGPQTICVRARAGERSPNKLGFYKLFRFSVASTSSVNFTIAGTVNPADVSSRAALDPDVTVYRQGAIVITSEDVGSVDTTAGTLTAGEYVAELYDYSLFPSSTIPSPPNEPRCMTVSVTGI